jgi:hypothetical protein
MNAIKLLRRDDKNIVSANDLFRAMNYRKSTADERDRMDDFRLWMADRILNFDMEEGVDYFIYIDARCVGELLKYESAPKEVRQLFESEVREEAYA